MISLENKLSFVGHVSSVRSPHTLHEEIFSWSKLSTVFTTCINGFTIWHTAGFLPTAHNLYKRNGGLNIVLRQQLNSISDPYLAPDLHRIHKKAQESWNRTVGNLCQCRHVRRCQKRCRCANLGILPSRRPGGCPERPGKWSECEWSESRRGSWPDVHLQWRTQRDPGSDAGGFEIQNSVEICLKAQPDLDTTSPDNSGLVGGTPLHWACYGNNQVGLARYLGLTAPPVLSTKNQTQL